MPSTSQLLTCVIRIEPVPVTPTSPAFARSHIRPVRSTGIVEAGRSSVKTGGSAAYHVILTRGRSGAYALAELQKVVLAELCARLALWRAPQEEFCVNRRTFVEALGAVCLTANGRLLRGAGILNGDVPDDVAVPALVPVPSSVAGVRQPVMSLAGEWRVNMDPPAEFWKGALDSSWTKMTVPNEFATQGFSVVPNREYPLRRTIEIPADFANQRIFLRL